MSVTDSHPRIVDLSRTVDDVHQVMADGGCLNDLWRFGILQTIDLYNSALARWGSDHARHVFDPEPITGISQVDCAYAALAEYFAERDNWTMPEWAQRTCNCDQPWLPAARPEYSLPIRIIDQSIEESPASFRKRHIYITLADLNRA